MTTGNRQSGIIGPPGPVGQAEMRRPWGISQTLAPMTDPGGGHHHYRCTQVTVFAGHELAMQYHSRATKTITVVAGLGRVEVGVDAIALGADGISSQFRDTPIYKWNVYPGTTILVPALCIHRIKCLGKSDESLVYIEVLRGEGLDGDDTTLLDDAYGRSSF